MERKFQDIKAYVCVHCSSGWPGFDEERHEIAPMYPSKQASGGTGDTYRSTELQFGIGGCTAMLTTHDFCEAVAKRATEFIKFPATEQEVLCSQTSPRSRKW